MGKVWQEAVRLTQSLSEPTPQRAATLPKREGEELGPTPQQAATLPKREGEEFVGILLSALIFRLEKI